MSVSTSQSNALTPLEREFVLLTQNGMPIIAQPYHWIAEQLNISVEQVYEMTEKFLESGIVRRIAAVPNHYKLGYTYNGMTVWDLTDEQASEYGKMVGDLPFVSHCYLRPRKLPSWNFNLFAMVHGKSPEEIEQQRAQIKALLADVLVERYYDQEQQQPYKQYDMLTSTQILKKTGLRLKRNSTEKA